MVRHLKFKKGKDGDTKERCLEAFDHPRNQRLQLGQLSEAECLLAVQAAAGGERYGQLFAHLLAAGIYWPPADLEAFFVSCMHTKRDLMHLAAELKNFFKM